MTVTGKTMAAVIPQIIAAPQPPMSRTDQPSDPSRKPGFARQITNPSYHRSVFRSSRSSTTASATLYLLVVSQAAAGLGRAATVAPGRDTCNGPRRTWASERVVQSVHDAQAPDHDQVRVRRDKGRCLR